MYASGKIIFNVKDVTLHVISSSNCRITLTKNIFKQQIKYDFIAGCDDIME